jgi:type VI secretion system protein ImpH
MYDEDSLKMGMYDEDSLKMDDPWKNLEPSHLLYKLQESPHEFEFHQAMRLLEIYDHGYSHENSKNSSIVFKSSIYLSYPSHDLEKIQIHDNRVWVTVNFFGIAGMQGPLPIPYTEMALNRFHQGDRAMADFLDIFNHGFIHIFHNIRKKYWLSLAHEKPIHHPYGQMLGFFSGVDTSWPFQQPLPLSSILTHGSILWQKTRHNEGLRSILYHDLRVKCDIIPFDGKWHPIDENMRSYLGTQNMTLGSSASLGESFWDQTTGCRLILGPVKWRFMRDILPCRPHYHRLYHWLSLYYGPHVDVRCVIMIKREDIQFPKLQNECFLGWTSRLMGRTPEIDQQLIITIKRREIHEI